MSNRNHDDLRLQLLQRRDRVILAISRTPEYDERVALQEILNGVREEIKKVEKEILIRDRAM